MMIIYVERANLPHWLPDLISLFSTAPSHSLRLKKKNPSLINSFNMITNLNWQVTWETVHRLSEQEWATGITKSQLLIDTRILSLVSLTKRNSTRFCLKAFKVYIKGHFADNKVSSIILFHLNYTARWWHGDFERLNDSLWWHTANKWLRPDLN